MPDFALEREHGAEAGRIVIGLDEAGRGPWAGPVIAAAAWLRPDALPASLLNRLDDSKALSAAARAGLFEEMSAARQAAQLPALAFAAGRAEVAEIDELNILQASLLAMRRACEALGPMLGRPVDMALVDGNRRPDLPCPVEIVVKGDARSLSIAAASIVAKVLRDREMETLAEAFPGYGWERNRGYGTGEHQAALARLGVTPQHRRSFRPVRERLSLKS